LHPERGNVAQLLWRSAEAYPDAIATVEGKRTVSYRDLRARAGAYAALLAESTDDVGGRIVLIGGRSTELAAAIFGTFAAGRTAVVISDSLRSRQIKAITERSGASAILAPGRHDSADSLGQSDSPLLLSDPTGEVEFEPVARAESDLAQLIFTSGSTGPPKGVMVSHGNLWAGVEAVESYLRPRRDDRIAALLPFAFDYGLSQVLLTTSVTATLVVVASPVPPRVDLELRSANVTMAAGVPTTWERLLETERFAAEPIASLRTITSSGSRLFPSVIDGLRRAQPQTALISMYGLTEAFRSSYLPAQKIDSKPASVGGAVPGAEVSVVRADGTPCQPFEVGEIVHIGPTVARGYWREPEATAQVFRPLGDKPAVWSGDFGWVDDEGDLFVKGRGDGIFKRWGFRVSTDEICEELGTSGLLRETAVEVEEDGAGQSLVVAHVSLAAGVAIADLEAFARRELPRHLVPDRYLAHDSLPATARGKIDRAALRRSAPQ
jgi:acyl-CoA synthetase (AMP-forming)/AMP-acid ligase II